MTCSLKIKILNEALVNFPRTLSAQGYQNGLMVNIAPQGSQRLENHTILPLNQIVYGCNAAALSPFHPALSSSHRLETR